MKDIDAKNYKEALDKLSKVIKEDSNYDSAQSKINEVVKLYKKEVMSKVDKDLSSKKYSEALNALKSLNNYCSDTDVKDKMDSVRDKKNAYDKKEQKRRIKKYKNNQEVEVISTKVVDAGYSLVFMNAYVTVKNNTSNKVAKDVELGMLLFDGNGYPVDADDLYKITYDNEESCELDSCNITPGKTYGSNSYFDVPDQCKKIKACVQEVTYTDGTVWENPYYNYWVDANYQSY